MGESSPPLVFQSNAFVGVNKEVPIEEIVALDFSISFKHPSAVIIVVKNCCEKWNIYRFALAHCAAAVVLIPLLLYLADYIILTEIILGGLAAFILVPKYMRAWSCLNKDGVQVYTFSDPADLVQLQKSVFEHPRGKKLIKRGLIDGKFIEEVCYCFLPNKWFNSDLFRDRVKFVGEVIYPIIVIVMPLVLTVLCLIGPVISQLKIWVTEDVVVRTLIRTTVFLGDKAEDHLDRFLVTRLIMKYYERLWNWYSYVIALLLGWLQTEVALFLMKVDYMQSRYLKVVKSVKKFGLMFLQIVFYPAIKLYQNTFGRYRKVREQQAVAIAAFQKTKQLHQEVGKVAAKAGDLVSDLHPKSE